MTFADAIESLKEMLQSLVESITDFVESIMETGNRIERYEKRDNGDWIDRKTGESGTWMVHTRGEG